MSNCGDLCTAAKCEELERRIEALEQALEEHKQQNIPEAHQFKPAWSVEVNVVRREIFVAVTIDNNSRFDTAKLPEQTIDIEGSFNSQTNLLNIDVRTPDDHDFALIKIPIPEIPEYEPSVTFDIFPQDNNSYVFKVNVDGETDEDTLRLEPSNLRLEGIFQSDTLTLTVADGESEDTASINIPLPTVEPSPQNQSNLRGSASFRDETLTISISDGLSQHSFQVNIPTNTSPQTIFVTEEIYMNCDELERKIENCCNLILTEIGNSQTIIIAEIEESENNLKNEIDNAQNQITRDIQTVEDYVTVDISGTIDTQYSCDIPLEDPEDSTSDTLPLPAQVSSELLDYSGVGLSGIHEQLKLVSNNLLKIYETVCTESTINVNLKDILNKICSDNLSLNRGEFSNESVFYNYSKALLEQEFKGLSSEKLLKLFKYTPGKSVSFTVGTTNDWAMTYLIEKSLKQQSSGITSICDRIDELEDRDVVSIVASDKNIHRVKGKILILHFVTLENYPKRKNSSSYRPIQIPFAKYEYDWLTDFDDLRWIQGNQYAELQFKEPYVPVSGWFKDKEAADAYFDKILTLTNATEDDRVIPDHSNPKTAIPVRETRPYRAFIKSVNSQGQAVCHAVYKPVIN